MRWFGLMPAVLLASPLWVAEASGDDKPVVRAVSTATVTLPPVLRRSERNDDVVVTLPGPVSTPANLHLPATDVRLEPPEPDPERPVLHRAKRDFPADFEGDSADFLGRQIGVWSQMDVQVLLGEPLRQRPAYSDDQTVNGQILAYDDPTGRYRELEIDFDQSSGLVRTVFVYPFGMTWQDCRHAFGANARPAQANKGRTFYSYMDRRLDVLVDASGKVISLGMY